MEKIYLILNFLLDNWEVLVGVALALYELIARKMPTETNISAIDNAHKLLNLVVKNRRKASPEDSITMQNSKKNIIEVDRDKHVL